MGIKVRRVFDKLPDNPERNTLYFVQRKINPLYMDIYDVDYNGHIAQYTYQFDRDDVIYGRYIDETVFSVNNKQFKLEPNKIYIDIDTKITYIYLNNKLVVLSSSNITSGKIKTIEELDAADKAGIYSVTLPENYLNFGTNHFFLMVGDNNDSGEKKQIAFLNDDMRMRVGTVGSWGVWKSIKEETLKALKQNVSTTTQLIKIYTENGFILKENGETASASGYVVYKFNVTGKTKVAVIGHSHTTGFCLACAYDINGVMLQNYAVAANADFTKEVIALPVGTNYINVCGTTSNLPAAYDVSERWIFYTTQEIDDKLANFNTEVHHDLTLKGNGKPDDNLSVNEEGLNSLDKYFVNTAEKAQITTNKNDITDLRALKTLITVSQNIIEVDCSKDLIESTNSGTSTAVFSFINLPSQKGTVRLIVKNARVADFAITLPYLNIVVGGVTYSFRNMTLANASLTCFADKSIEINFLFVKTAKNAYTISIAAIYEY